MRTPFQGGCLCGGVRYVCHAAPLSMVNCHCRDCQLAGGGGYAPTIVVPRDALELTRGSVRGFDKPADGGNRAFRQFCPTCGTPLFAFSSALPDRIGIRAATLDDPAGYRPSADVWVKSAQPWDHLTEETRKYESGRRDGGTAS